MKKEYNFSKMKEVKNPYPRQKKKAVGINLSSVVINYFKDLSEETGFSYQKLIDLYLLDCVKRKKAFNEVDSLKKVIALSASFINAKWRCCTGMPMVASRPPSVT